MQSKSAIQPGSCVRKLLAMFGACLGCFGIAQATAQDYPSRPVRIIVPFSAGGAVDGPMRVIAQELSKRLNQQVIVENRPGAGATIGSEAVAKSAPDGYSLLLASQTNAISSSLYSKLNFDPIEASHRFRCSVGSPACWWYIRLCPSRRWQN